MKCPACENELAEKIVDGITVDICDEGCGGVWFDNFEFKKFDEPHESAGESLSDIEGQQGLELDHSEKRGCPKCPNIIMRRYFYSAKRKTEIDECPTCAGIWLDGGELKTIRAAFESEEEKDKAADKYLNEMFSGDFEKARKKTEEQRAKSTGLPICSDFWSKKLILSRSILLLS